MSQIISLKKAIGISHKLQQAKKTIVVAGGCFDLLHLGHLAFLKESKKQGDILFILLESNQQIKKIKGKNRPVQNQNVRAQAIKKLGIADFVVLLPSSLDDSLYDAMIFALKPAIITTTKGDSLRFHKERQAKLVKGCVIDVIERLTEYSTTKQVKN